MDDDSRRKKFRDRFRSDEDVYGEADAEDRADNHSAENLSFGANIAGLDRDLDYERSYRERHEDRRGYDPAAYTPPNQWNSGPPPPQSGLPPVAPGELPPRAKNLEERIQRRTRRTYDRRSEREQSGGIDSLFDANLDLSRFIPCSNSVLFLLVLMIGGLGCAAMAVLAYGSLARHLGF